MHIAILSDYAVATFANGPAFSTQTLKRYLEQRGHRVTIVAPAPGPDDPEPPEGSLLFSAVDYKGHPGVRFAFPFPDTMFDNAARFDVIHSHANSLAMHWAPVMRKLHGIPCLATNTIYLPAWAQFVLHDKLYKIKSLREVWSGFARTFERKFARVYNQHDGLIVQCAALANYWRDVGTLEVPLHVIPRPIDRAMFDSPLGPDPIRADFAKGKRLIVVCRHSREKDVDKIIRVLAQHVLPAQPEASLTLVGDGLDHKHFVRLAETLGVAHRCQFTGELPHRALRHYYGHADVFVYASVTETYGQVVSEALWCGLPVVAVQDGMGVAFQCQHGHDAMLIERGDDEIGRFGAAVVDLLADDAQRRAMGQNAAARARTRVPPEIVYGLYEKAYESAIEHHRTTKPRRYDMADPFDRLAVGWEHMFPWLWQHAALCSIGALRGGQKDFKLRADLRLDAMPGQDIVRRRGA